MYGRYEMKYQIFIKKAQRIWKNYRKSSKIIRSVNKNRKKIIPAVLGIVEILKALWGTLRELVIKK